MLRLLLTVAFLLTSQMALTSQTTSTVTKAPTESTQEGVLEITKAHDLLEQGKVGEALDVLKSLQARDENLKGLNRELGVAYYRTGDYLRASVFLEKATAVASDDKEAVQLLGLAYFFTGKPKLAIPLLERVQSWYPSAHVDASYVLGVSYIQTTDYENARKAFASMYGVPKDSAASHLFLARMLMRQGYDPVAEQEAKKAIAIDPKLPMVHFLLGESYIFKSRIPAAIKEFETELAINPGHAATYYRLADAYTRVLRWDDAERLLQQSIWLDATASGPYILMGKVLLKKNDAVLAIRSLRRALSMDPNNYIAHNLLGQAYRMQGKTAEAEAELRMSQKLQDAQGQSKPELQ